MKLSLGQILLLSLILLACNSNQSGEPTPDILPNLVKLTDNEDKGIKQIIEFYGGQCEYGYENNFNIQKKKEINFWIKFSKSADIDSLEKMAELPSSNIAYIFYKNLDKEKNKYNEIQSELVFGDGQNIKYSYTISQLEKVKVKIELVDKIVNLIGNRKFSDIKTYLNNDTTLFNYDRDELVSKIQKAEQNFGNIKQFVPYGFKFSKKPNGQDILHISGLIARDKNSNYFSVNLDPNSVQEKIYTLNYGL